MAVRRFIQKVDALFRLSVVTVGLLAFHEASCAAPLFQPVSHERSVSITGALRLYDVATQDQQRAEFNDSRQSEPGPLAELPLRLGMGIELAGGTCFGQGIASQLVTVEEDRFSFEGVADVNMSGYTSYPYFLEGEGNANVRFSYKFLVSQPQEILLFMDSGVGSFKEDDFKFSLKHGEDYIFSETSVFNQNDEIERSFSRRFVLAPGEYSVSAVLAADSRVFNDSSFAGRSWAKFSVTAVPEPGTALLFLTGGFLVLVLSRRRHR